MPKKKQNIRSRTGYGEGTIFYSNVKENRWDR